MEIKTINATTTGDLTIEVAKATGIINNPLTRMTKSIETTNTETNRLIFLSNKCQESLINSSSDFGRGYT